MATIDISEVLEDDEAQAAETISMPRVKTTKHALQVSVKTSNNNTTNSQQLYLYGDDLDLYHRPLTPVAASISSTPAPQHTQQQQQPHQGHEPPSNQVDPEAMDNSSSSKPANKHHKQPANANLGILSGVYFPCVQNIFGVILFIRMVWIVGTAGVPTAFTIVFICCCVTFTTSISLSAIATNGIVPGGGPYFMISRSLGPEYGGAVGTMFFLGTTVAGAMYITGAVEIMLNYMAPSWGLFGDFQRDVTILYHNIRVYGSLLLIVVGCMVWIGVKFVSRLAPIALFCVLFSIASIYAGIFINANGRQDLTICVVGDRLVTLKSLPFDDKDFLSSIHSSSSNINSTLKGLMDDVSKKEIRKNKALCRAEKLAHVFCPNESLLKRALTYSNSSFILAAADSYDVSNSGSILQSSDYETTTQQTTDQPTQQTEEQTHQQQPPLSSSLSNKDMQQKMEMRLADIGRHVFSRPPNMSNCDEYFWANRHRIRLERAVPGILSGVLGDNLKQRFRAKGAIIGYDDSASSQQDNSRKWDYNYVFVDITTSFTIFISIYFPSCTGILAGSNRSGDLADAQRSIPLGTISAQLTTSFVYLSSVILFGSTFNNLFIRDKFGESMGGQLAVTQIAWPHPFIILIGGLLSTLGAALQSLVGAPRILQGIARDEVIPVFACFAKLSPRGEPETAIKFTLLLAWFAVLIGNLDFIAPILTESLVMCYLFINLSCTLQSVLKSPGWRPRFKHYHWIVSTIGCLLCLFVMLVSSWIYFVVAFFLAAFIYKYIEFRGAEKEWGDGWSGLALSAARYALLRVETNEPHTKNWRPQVLLLAKMKPTLELEPTILAGARIKASKSSNTNANINQQQNEQVPSGAKTDNLNTNSYNYKSLTLNDNHQLDVAHPKLLTFSTQLKAGRGLTLVSSVLEGDLNEPQMALKYSQAKVALAKSMANEKVEGFSDVLVSRSIVDGLKYQIQTAGLGGLKHNTVIVGWPEHWRRRLIVEGLKSPSDLQQIAALQNTTNNQQQQQQDNKTRAHLFIELVRSVRVLHNALLVVKGVDMWPENVDKLGGYIDIWWIVNDGGLLMLLPHLLRQHRTWKACQLRVFTVAQPNEDIEQMRQDLEKFLYHLRIEVSEVNIVTMDNSQITSYAYERTLIMEQRAEIMRRLNLNRRQSILLEQDDGRLLRIRKPSTSDLEDAISLLAIHASPVNAASVASVADCSNEDKSPLIDAHNDPQTNKLTTSTKNNTDAGPTDTPTSSRTPTTSGAHIEMRSLRTDASKFNEGGPKSGPATATTTTAPNNEQLAIQPLKLPGSRPRESNVRRMHTALTLNEAILTRSKAAKLVIINLPDAPHESTSEAENNFMEFIETITNKLERVLLVQNEGREVITIQS